MGSDPLSGFFVYQFAQNSTGELQDQPKVGVSDDKVVIAWDDIMPGSVYAGTELWVLQKSALLSGGRPATVSFGPAKGLLSLVPAQSLSSTTTEYAVHDGSLQASVLAINGTPAQSSVTLTPTNVSMPAAVNPPPATQQGGGTINTGDDRFLSAVWRNGKLWTSGNVGCYQPGSSTQRACLRLVEMSTSPGPSLVQALTVSPSGSDVYYPAVTTDANGDLFVAFSMSSSTLFASAAVGELAAVGGGGAMAIFMQGMQHYAGSTWGDYSAISVDPVSGGVWAAAEYAATGSVTDWGTAVSLYTP
jgi:hypothetical protein